MVRDCLGEHTVDRLLRAQISAGELAQMDAHIDRCEACRALVSCLASCDDAAGPRSVTALASQIAADLAREAPVADAERGLAASDVLADRFVLEERVGAGGMAEIFRARDLRTGARVAIKLPRSSAEDDVVRFEREAAILLELDHVAIVKHIAEGRTASGAPFLAMEWLEGEDLARRLERAPLTLEETLIVGCLIADALGAAHAAGLVHRDVKPSNIFLRRGRVDGATLIDFGIARRLSPASAATITRTGMLLGTLGYMAPEQATGAKAAEARADVFSLGCVLYECLTAERAFRGRHAVEVLAALLTQKVPSPRASAPSVPPELDALVRRMLARDPAKRPANGAEVAEQLARIASHGSYETRGPGRALLVALAAMMLVLGALAWRARSATPQPEHAPASASIVAASIESTANPIESPAATSAPEPPRLVASSSAPRASARPAARAAAPHAPPPPAAVAPAVVTDPFGSSRN